MIARDDDDVAREDEMIGDGHRSTLRGGGAPPAYTLDVRSVVRLSDTVLIASSLTVAIALSEFSGELPEIVEMKRSISWNARCALRFFQVDRPRHRASEGSSYSLSCIAPSASFGLLAGHRAEK